MLKQLLVVVGVAVAGAGFSGSRSFGQERLVVSVGARRLDGRQPELADPSGSIHPAKLAKENGSKSSQNARAPAREVNPPQE